MGSGDKITWGKLATPTIGLGLYIGRFPFNLTIGVTFIFWFVQLGFGKGYDE